jgi:uncharacterized membrane protein YdjX (TVP38/TMEM64 family)
MRARRALRVLAVVVFYALPVTLSQLPPVRAALIALIESMRAEGFAGPAIYVASYAIGGVVLAPVMLFSGIAGYLWGPVRGVLLASPANALAATFAFVAGRSVLAGPVARALGDSPRWDAVRRAVSAEGFRIALLVRLTPFAPQNVVPYGFAITPVRAGSFIAATWIGMLPLTCFQVYMGSMVHEVTDILDGKRPPLGPWGWVATAAGIAGTIAALALVARTARRALARSGV